MRSRPPLFPTREITEELNPCHWAQGMVYITAIFSSKQGWKRWQCGDCIRVDTDQIQRFTRQFRQQQLGSFAAAFNAVCP